MSPRHAWSLSVQALALVAALTVAGSTAFGQAEEKNIYKRLLSSAALVATTDGSMGTASVIDAQKQK